MPGVSHDLAARCWESVSAVSCDCLGDRIMGKDVDAIFAYATPKVVRIQDRTLGVLKIFLSLVIFAYIFVFQIWYRGEHFQMTTVQGIARMQWQEPTLSWCNPRDIDCEANYVSVQNLPYCSGYRGSNASTVVRKCGYYDAMDLPIDLPGGTLLPTFIRTYKQARGCAPDDLASCQRTFKYLDANGTIQRGEGGARPINESFVADIEDFTLLIDHSFRTADGSMAFDDFNMQGYWSLCEGGSAGKDCVKRPIKCVHSNCKEALGGISGGPTVSFLAGGGGGGQESQGERRARARQARVGFLGFRRGMSNISIGRDPSATERAAAAEAKKADLGIISISNGDVVSLKTLLAMARLSLDHSWWVNGSEPRSLRLRGTALVVNIQYHNLKPWMLFRTQNPPEYTISVTTRPINKFKHTYVTSETAEGRMFKVAYGVYIILEQSGEIGHFTFVHSLIILTAAMGLFAVANTFTDILAMYVLPKRQLYQGLKFEDSEDMVTVGEKG